MACPASATLCGAAAQVFAFVVGLVVVVGVVAGKRQNAVVPLVDALRGDWELQR